MAGMRLALCLASMMIACQPGPASQDVEPGCPEDDPLLFEAQGYYVGDVCSELFLTNGEGRSSEIAMSNSRFRALIRSPVASLTFPGLGGGTLIDAAPWGFSDHLHEAAPLVGGGWLDTDEIEVQGNRVIVRGTIASLPDQPAEREGETAELAWVIEPDDPWLRVEGAQGFYIHAAGDVDLLDGWLTHATGATYGHDGATVQDLGGAIRVTDATALLIDGSKTVWSHRPEPLMTISGEAIGADRLLLYRETEVVGWIKVTSDTFDAEVPSSVTTVQATADVATPSEAAAPGEDLILRVGETAELEVLTSWTVFQRPRPIRVSWLPLWPGAPDHVRVDPEGQTVTVPAQELRLTFSAGPNFEHQSKVIDLTNGASTLVHLPSITAANDHVLTAIGVRPDRSRKRRSTDEEVLQTLLLDGVDATILAAEDDISAASALNRDKEWIRWQDGSRLTSWDDYTIVSWPWRADERFGGHGAGDGRGRSPLDALRIAWGGAGTARYTQVDLGWMAAVDLPPWRIQPPPDLLRLTHPGTSPSDTWMPWFEWLDAGLDLHPSGPRHQVKVTDDDLFGYTDVMRGLVRGQHVATTGPMVRLRVDGFEPGDVWSLEPLDAPLDTAHKHGRLLEVEVDDAAFDTVALIGEGGEELMRWSVDAVPFRAEVHLDPGKWVVAAAWSRQGPDWAVTAPVWVQPPARGRIRPCVDLPSQGSQPHCLPPPPLLPI